MRNEIRAMEALFRIFGELEVEIQLHPKFTYYLKVPTIYLKGAFVVGSEPHPIVLTLLCVACMRPLAIVAVLHEAGHSCGYLGGFHVLLKIYTPIWDFRRTPIRFAS